MMNLKILFRKQSLLRAIPWMVTIFSFLGFLDAAYLTIEHYLGGIPPCSIVSGCETVLTSAYAEILGIPVALIGALYYFTIFMSALLLISFNSEFLWTSIAVSSSVGFLASVYFIYLQIFVIGAVCLYCLFSAAMTFMILSVVIMRYFAKRLG